MTTNCFACLFYTSLSFACVCCGFLEVRGFLHSFCSGSLLFVPVLFRLLSFVSLRFCVGLHRLVLGSELTVVFVGVARDEPSGNKQMAHSQIVIVIVFS